jgi:hypothetical protein
MDLEIFENDIFGQIFNTNLNKIVQKNFKDFFQEYCKNTPPKNHLGGANGSY